MSTSVNSGANNNLVIANEITKNKDKVMDMTSITENNPIIQNNSSNLTVLVPDQHDTGIYKKGSAPVSISFDTNISNETSKTALESKNNPTKEDINILNIISKAEETTFKAILESFDHMLAHARKIMEENQRYVKEKLIPNQEAIKKEIQHEEIKKEILKTS